jgi:hypothetical protein
MKHLLVTLCAVCATLVSATAGAEEKQAPQKVETKVTTKVVEVHGRASRPAVVIEITRARMTLPVTTPTLAGLTKVQEASKKDPFQ